MKHLLRVSQEKYTLSPWRVGAAVWPGAARSSSIHATPAVDGALRRRERPPAASGCCAVGVDVERTSAEGTESQVLA